MRQMHADLVGSAGLQTAGKECGSVSETLFDCVARHRAAAAVLGDRLLQAVLEIAI